MYPQAVQARFEAPRWVCRVQGAEWDGPRTPVVRTPASAEAAALYRGTDGRCYWRAHASPWLTAALECLCEVCNRADQTGADAAAGRAELEDALNSLQLGAGQRYCAVMARELWDAWRELSQSSRN